MTLNKLINKGRTFTLTEGSVSFVVLANVGLIAGYLSKNSGVLLEKAYVLDFKGAMFQKDGNYIVAFDPFKENFFDMQILGPALSSFHHSKT